MILLRFTTKAFVIVTTITTSKVRDSAIKQVIIAIGDIAGDGFEGEVTGGDIDGAQGDAIGFGDECVGSRGCGDDERINGEVE